MKNDLYFLIDDIENGYSVEFLSKKSSNKEITDKILSVFYQVNEYMRKDDYFSLKIEDDNLYLMDNSLKNTFYIGEICEQNLDDLYSGSFNPYFESYGGKISVFENLQDLKDYLVEDFALKITDCFKKSEPMIELENNITIPEKFSNEIDDLISQFLNSEEIFNLLHQVNIDLENNHLKIIDHNSLHNFFYPELLCFNETKNVNKNGIRI